MKQSLLNKMRGMSEADLFKAMYRDHLTGALNRRAMDEQLALGGHIIGIIDLDSLKYLNDEMGHRTGDCMLRKLTHKLINLFSGDNVYRIGGDEFAVVFNRKSYDDIETLEMLIHAFQQNFNFFSYGLGYTLSQADEVLKASKTRREFTGERAKRGECPPWLETTIKPSAIDDAMRNLNGIPTLEQLR